MNNEHHRPGRSGCRGRRRDRQRARAGVTLVEAMYAVVILAIITIAAGAFVQRAWQRMVVARDRRVAVETASAQMETMLYGVAYTNVEAMVGIPDTDAVTLNGRSGFDMVTTVTDDGPDECLRIEVRVEFVPGDPDSVVRLETLRAP